MSLDINYRNRFQNLVSVHHHLWCVLFSLFGDYLRLTIERVEYRVGSLSDLLLAPLLKEPDLRRTAAKVTSYHITMYSLLDISGSAVYCLIGQIWPPAYVARHQNFIYHLIILCFACLYLCVHNCLE